MYINNNNNNVHCYNICHGPVITYIIYALIPYWNKQKYWKSSSSTKSNNCLRSSTPVTIIQKHRFWKSLLCRNVGTPQVILHGLILIEWLLYSVCFFQLLISNHQCCKGICQYFIYTGLITNCILLLPDIYCHILLCRKKKSSSTNPLQNPW